MCAGAQADPSAQPIPPIGQRVDDRYRNLLKPEHFDAVESHLGSAFGVWPDLRIAYVNPSWFRFAATNNGEPVISRRWSLHASIKDAMSDCVAELYGTIYELCLEQRRQRSYEYECSSAARYRRYLTTIYPLRNGEGLLFVNSLSVDRPHDRHPLDPDASTYRDQSGQLPQCCFCRRVKNNIQERWDWVPAYIEHAQPHVKYTLCTLCERHYPVRLRGEWLS